MVNGVMNMDESEEWQKENTMNMQYLCDQTSTPTELVACPHATVYKLLGFLTLALHDNVFNNKSFHDVKYISSS